MSSCLEKVIEKLTAYKGGALTGLAEMRPSLSQKGEGPSPSRNHMAEHGAPPAAPVEPVTCKDERSSADHTTTFVKRERCWGDGGSPLHPSFHIKEEPRLGLDRNFFDLFPPLEFTQYTPVHIKEEPREGEHLHNDGRLTQGSMFSAPPLFYPQKGHFLSHQLVPASDKPFYCAECGRGFSQRSYFLSHQKIHSGERPFCCFRCGKSFRIKSSFSKHLRTHHQVDNPFTCPLCHKSFVHRGHFLAHQRLHAEEEKFCCPLCGKSFIHHGHFLAHQRSHAEESRFSCPHCHKSFIHRGHFSAHLRVHTGEKPFVCPDCGNSFSTQHNLVVHQRLHAGPSFTLL